MTAFDSFLNFLVPILAVLALLWVFYKPFKKPIDSIGKWIMKIIKGEEEDIGEQLEGGYNIPTIRDNLDFE